MWGSYLWRTWLASCESCVRRYACKWSLRIVRGWKPFSPSHQVTVGSELRLKAYFCHRDRAFSCLTSLYDQPLPFSPTTEILSRGSLGEMDQGRDFSKGTKNQGLQTVCRSVALMYAQLPGKRIPSAFHKLVPLDPPHRRPGVQTWWKSSIFLAPMGEI